MSEKLTKDQEVQLQVLIEELQLEQPLTNELHEELIQKVLNA